MAISCSLLRASCRWQCNIIVRLSKTGNISDLSMSVYYNTNSFFREVSQCLSSLILIKILNAFEHNFLKVRCFMLLLNFTTSKYSFFRMIIKYGISFSRYVLFLEVSQFPHKHFLYCHPLFCFVILFNAGHNTKVAHIYLHI